jgi:hypothetical protein
MAGQQQYLSAVEAYVETLASATAEVRRELLGHLGFHMVEDFITCSEEAAMCAYWGPDGPTFDFGTKERISGRRWFEYGPVLPRETQGTTKSTLTVIPSAFGGMPPFVQSCNLQDRVRQAAQR